MHLVQCSLLAIYSIAGMLLFTLGSCVSIKVSVIVVSVSLTLPARKAGHSDPFALAHRHVVLEA